MDPKAEDTTTTTTTADPNATDADVSEPGDAEPYNDDE